MMNSWEELLRKAKGLVEEFNVRERLLGKLWTMAFEKCVTNIVSGIYDANKPILQQFVLRLEEVVHINLTYSATSRADKLL